MQFISHGGIDFSSTHISPFAAPNWPDSAGLVWGENGKADFLFRQDIEGLQVHCRLGEPHPFRFPPEALLEVSHSPENLGVFVPAVCQGENHMVIRLGEG